MDAQVKPRPSAELSQRAGTRTPSRRVPIYHYSDMIYWWTIWLAAGICAAHTWLMGDVMTIGGKAVKVDANPWLGLSFVGVMFLTLTLITFRARGIYAIVLALALALGALGVHHLLGWGTLMEAVSHLRIHANLAFYVVVFFVTFALWLYAMFVQPRVTYWFVRPGEVGHRSPFSGHEDSFRSHNVRVNRRGDDFFVHKIFGLAFLGLGTGDIIIDIDVPGQGHEQHVLTNVFRPKRKVEIIQHMIQATEQT